LPPSSSSGIFYTETKSMFGTFAPNDYGPNASTRTSAASLPVYLESNGYIHYDYGGNAGGTEVALMVLDYYLYTEDLEALKKYLPIVALTVDFFRQHYPMRKSRAGAGSGAASSAGSSAGSGDQEYVFFPSQAIETFWCAYPPTTKNCCTNDLPTVAALHSLLRRLLALPPAAIAACKISYTVRAQWVQFEKMLPPLPKTSAGVLDNAESYPPHRHNSETPELYATHPVECRV
jgi:hypothetical protein